MNEADDMPVDLRDLLSAERQAQSVNPGLRARLASRLETTLGMSLPHATRWPTSDLQDVSDSPAAGALQTTSDHGAAAAVARAATPAVSKGLASAVQWLLLKPLAAALVFGAGTALGSALTLGIQAGLAAREASQHAPAAVAPAMVSVAVPPAPPSVAGASAQPIPAAPTREKNLATEPRTTPPAGAAARETTLAARRRPAVLRERVAVSSSSGTDLHAEQLLVDQARSALGRDRPEDALRALDAHLQRYPTGQLAEERASLYVVALARTRRMEEARHAAQQFHVRYPNSLFGAIVDTTLDAPAIEP